MDGNQGAWWQSAMCLRAVQPHVTRPSDGLYFLCHYSTELPCPKEANITYTRKRKKKIHSIKRRLRGSCNWVLTCWWLNHPQHFQIYCFIKLSHIQAPWWFNGIKMDERRQLALRVGFTTLLLKHSILFFKTTWAVDEIARVEHFIQRQK